MVNEIKTVAIKLNQDYCSKCRICCSVCPFEAILLNADTSEIRIDIEKCLFCGICASACPSSAIELAYYDNESLIGYVREQIKGLETETLVLMCRGSSSPSCEILDVLREQGVSKFIPLRLPCMGRVSSEFYLHALVMGIKKIIISSL